jgi:hypothetical protein
MYNQAYAHVVMPGYAVMPGYVGCYVPLVCMRGPFVRHYTSLALCYLGLRLTLCGT